MGICTQMFISFSKIGAFTLGGGYAMVPILEKEVVDRRKWLGREEFMDILVVSQSMPGLFAINMASHIGYKLKGLVGGIIGALSVAGPSIVSILLIAMFFRTFKDNIYVEKIFMGVRPAVVALIASPCFNMAKTAKISRHNIWIPVVSALLICSLGVSPIWVIVVAGVSGFFYGRYKRSKEVRGGESGK